MGELEKAYGAALSKTKRGVYKQAAVAGVIGLGGVYIAKEKYKKRKEAAQRILDFQTSVNPLLVQHKQLYRDGTTWWNDLDTKLNNSNQQVTEDGIRIALKNEAEQEILGLLKLSGKTKEDLDSNAFRDLVDARFNYNFGIHEEEKKLYSDFKPYSTMEKATGQKKYLAPIMKDIERVEKLIAKDSNLGRSITRKIMGEPDPTIVDAEVIGAMGKTHFVPINSKFLNSQAGQSFVSRLNSNKNKLLAADQLTNQKGINVQFGVNADVVTNTSFINALVTGEGGPSLIKSDVDNEAFYNSIKNELSIAWKGEDLTGARTDIDLYDHPLNSSYTDGIKFYGKFTIPQFNSPTNLTTEKTYHDALNDFQNLFKTNEEFRAMFPNVKTSGDFIRRLEFATSTLAAKVKAEVTEPLTQVGAIQEQREFRFDDLEYYEAAFQTVVNNMFEDLSTGTDLIARVDSIDPRTLARTMVDDTKQQIQTNTNDSTTADMTANKLYEFKNSDGNIQNVTLNNYVDALFTQIKEAPFFKRLDIADKINFLDSIIFQDKQNNEALFKSNPALETAYNRYFNNLKNNFKEAEKTSSNSMKYAGKL